MVLTRMAHAPMPVTRSRPLTGGVDEAGGDLGLLWSESVQRLAHAGFGFVAEAFKRGLEQGGDDAR